jgi:hypothetical protein
MFCSIITLALPGQGSVPLEECEDLRVSIRLVLEARSAPAIVGQHEVLFGNVVEDHNAHLEGRPSGRPARGSGGRAP